MPTTRHEVYDGQGNMIDSWDEPIPPEEANEQLLAERVEQNLASVQVGAGSPGERIARLEALAGSLAGLQTGATDSPPPPVPDPPDPAALQGPAGADGAPGPPGIQGPPGTPADPSLLPTTGQKNALAGTQGTPGATNQYVTTQDPRNSDARPPTAHTHTASQVTDFNATGDARWALAGQGGFSWTAVPRQAADSTQATTAFKASDLTFPFVANGVYAVELFLLMRSSLATAGFRLALDTSVAVTTVALNFAHTLANAGTVTSGQSRADAIATGLSSGVDTVNVDIPVFGHGILVAGANAGTATLVFGPEVTATATMKANSVMRVHKVA